jgi:hypothetical protein
MVFTTVAPGAYLTSVRAQQRNLHHREVTLTDGRSCDRRRGALADRPRQQGSPGGQEGVRNAHIFFDTGDRLEKIFIFSHPPREDLAPRVYDQMIHYGYPPEGLRPYLADAIRTRNPRRIGLNMFAHTADRRWTDRIAQKLPGRGNRPGSCRT